MPRFGLRRRRLDRRHRADEGQLVGLAQLCQRDGGGRVAGNHHDMRLHLLDQRADDVENAARPAPLPSMRHRERRHCRRHRRDARRAAAAHGARHGQAAHAGIEQQNARPGSSLRPPFRRSCARVSEETMPRRERTSCSVSSARAKRLRMLRSMPGFLSSVLKKPADIELPLEMVEESRRALPWWRAAYRASAGRGLREPAVPASAGPGSPPGPCTIHSPSAARPARC